MAPVSISPTLEGEAGPARMHAPELPVDMIGVLTTVAPSSDAEALSTLRRVFPQSALADRVAVVGQWRVNRQGG